MVDIKDTLPDTLSELIRVAIKDMNEIAEDSRYILDMYEWHTPESNVECRVCLAGSVMAKTLRTPATTNIDIEEIYKHKMSHKLIALDYVRGGHVCAASSKVGDRSMHQLHFLIEYEDTLLDKHKTLISNFNSYPMNYRKEFSELMLKVADDLEEEGL